MVTELGAVAVEGILPLSEESGPTYNKRILRTRPNT